MQDEDKTIKIARVNSRQAIIVAIIVGFVSIITTLISTGNLFPKKVQGTSGDGIDRTTASPSVTDAPHIQFSTREIDLSLEQCMNNAKDALNARDDQKNSYFTGMDSARYFAWAYQGQTTAFIWCHTDKGIVVFMGSGKDWQLADKAVLELRRLFRTQP